MWNAIVVETELRRERKSRFVGGGPVQRRACVVRRIVQAKADAASEASVHFKSGLEFFPAERAGLRPGGQSEWAADGPGVPEFPGVGGKTLFRNEILAHIPAAEVAPQN